METCPGCAAPVQEKAAVCGACGAAVAAGFSPHLLAENPGKPPPAAPPAEEPPSPRQDPADAEDDDYGEAAWGNVPWTSSWSGKGFRLAFKIGLVLAVVLWLLDLAHDPGRVSAVGILVGLPVALAFGVLLGVMLCVPCAVAGILLEALVKTFVGRPRGIDQVLARHGKEAKRTVIERLREGEHPPDGSPQPSPQIVPAPPAAPGTRNNFEGREES